MYFGFLASTSVRHQNPVEAFGDLASPITRTGMTSPDLEQPLVPLTVALPLLLAKIEAELTHDALGAAEKMRFRQRAGLMRWLLRANRPDGDDHAA